VAHLGYGAQFSLIFVIRARTDILPLEQGAPLVLLFVFRVRYSYILVSEVLNQACYLRVRLEQAAKGDRSAPCFNT
jgi:hypothetical protein